MAARSPAVTFSTVSLCDCKPRILTSFWWGRSSRLVPTCVSPESTEPVTTVPKPFIVNERSTGIQNIPRSRSSFKFASSFSSSDLSSEIPSPVVEETAIMGAVAKNVSWTKLLTSSLTRLNHSASTRSLFVIAMIPFLMRKILRMSRCSLVCGITPSSAATTNNTRSTVLTPATILRMNFSCPGTSMIVALSPMWANPKSMVKPRAFSSFKRSVSTPVRTFTNAVLP